jgi:GNAT superfamily N-acetyltransferase
MNSSNSIRGRRRSTTGSNAGRARTKRASHTYVVAEGRRVVGYYSLAAGSVLHAEATGRVRRNMPDPVPAALLGRLAVDRQWQGRGLGAALLRDAVLRMIGAAGTIGVRALLMHAISDEAKAFYEHWGFRPSLSDRADDADDHDRGSAENARGNAVRCVAQNFGELVKRLEMPDAPGIGSSKVNS